MGCEIHALLALRTTISYNREKHLFCSNKGGLEWTHLPNYRCH